MDIGLILTVGIVTFLVVSAFVGFVRGSKKALFRFITVALSATVAFVAVVVFKNLLGEEAITARVNTLLAQNGLKQVLDIAASSPLFEEVILKTVGGIAAPLLFFIVFFAVSTVTYVLYFLFTLIFRRALKTEKSGCVGGIFALILGFGQGVIITAALILTITSYTLIVPEIAPKLESAESLNESQRGMVTELNKTIDEANKSEIISIYRSCGLDLAAHSLMDYEIKLETETLKIGMADEISSISELVFVFMDLSSSPMAEYGEAEAVLIQKLGNSFTHSRVLSLAGSELLHSATECWKKGEPFAGMARPDLGSDMAPLLTKLIEIFNESTKKTETFNEDVITTANLIAVFAKNGIFSASTQLETNPSALFDCIAKDGVISEITLTLNTNSRMGALIPEITNLGLKTLAHSLGIADNTTEIYAETLNNIASHINSTKNETDVNTRIEALKPLLKTEFESIGVTVEPEYIGILASALIEDFGSFDGEINADFVAEFFDVYSNVVAGGTAQTSGGASTPSPLGTSVEEKTYAFPKYANPGSLLASGAVGAANQSLASIASAAPERLDAFKASDAIISGMRSSETAIINRATIRDFLVDSDCVITNPEAESAALERIVKEVVAIMNALNSPENNGIETVKSFSSRLGGALDGLSETEMYGSDKTFTLFTAILQSKTLRDTTKITVPETIKLTDKHRENADKVSFGSLMNVLSSTVEVITSMQNSETSTESIEELIHHITPENSEIIKEIITVERIEEMGVPKENAETTTEIMSNLFGNLGEIDDPEIYEDEAKAVENIITLGIAAKDLLNGNNGGSGSTGDGTDSGSGDGTGSGTGTATPEPPKTNLFTPTVNKDEGGNGGDGSGDGSNEGGTAPSVEEGALGCTADELVNNIMSSTAVCKTIVDTAKDNKDEGDNVGGPFGIGESISDSDRQAIIDACDNYVNQNSDKSPEDMAKINETLESITWLLGITGWTVPNIPVPTP